MAAGNRMAYVSVPKDLTKVKNKVAFNLTRRQIICFSIAGVIGFPFYFLTRNLIGNGNAMMGMVLLMVPAFLFAMYEKDGMPLEKVLMNMITVKYKRPHVRRYETVNLFEMPELSSPASSIKGRGDRRLHFAKGKETVYAAGNYGKNMRDRFSEESIMADPPVSGKKEEYGRSFITTGSYGVNQEGGRNRARQG